MYQSMIKAFLKVRFHDPLDFGKFEASRHCILPVVVPGMRIVFGDLHFRLSTAVDSVTFDNDEDQLTLCLEDWSTDDLDGLFPCNQSIESLAKRFDRDRWTVTDIVGPSRGGK